MGRVPRCLPKPQSGQGPTPVPHGKCTVIGGWRTPRCNRKIVGTVGHGLAWLNPVGRSYHAVKGFVSAGGRSLSSLFDTLSTCVRRPWLPSCDALQNIVQHPGNLIDLPDIEHRHWAAWAAKHRRCPFWEPSSAVKKPTLFEERRPVCEASEAGRSLASLGAVSSAPSGTSSGESANGYRREPPRRLHLHRLKNRRARSMQSSQVQHRPKK